MSGFRIGSIPLIIIMVIIAIVSLFPFWLMINMGTYYSNDLYTSIKIIPGNYLLQNLKTLSTINHPRYYMNSLVVALSCAALTVLVCSMAGFAFSKYRFKGKNVLMQIVLLSMLVPLQLGVVGFVIEMKFFGWIKTLLPLIIPNAASAFGVYWMTQYTKGAIPDSVIESAYIDGCNDFRVYVQIAMPFMRPACFTLALLSFLWSWNAFMVPSIIITTEKLFTIPLGIRQLATQYRMDVAAQILGLTFGTLPMLLVFAAFSKNLISGLAVAAVKE